MKDISPAKGFCITLGMFLGILITIDRISPFMLPLESYYFRPWEYSLGGHRYMIPRNDTSTTMKAYGDLANMIGVEKFREEKEVTFTVDQYGKRNSYTTQQHRFAGGVDKEDFYHQEHPFPGAFPEEATIIVIGNSFMAGSANTDSDTFVAKLQEALPNEKVYGYVPGNMSEFLKEARAGAETDLHLRLNGKVILWGRVERNLHTSDAEITNILADTSCFSDVSQGEKLLEEVKMLVKNSIKDVREYARLSILKRTFRNMFAETQFQLLGIHVPTVTVGLDRSTLFFNRSLRLLPRSAEKREMDQVALAIEKVQLCLKEQGASRFLIIPIPDKPHIYSHLVPGAVLPTQDPLDALTIHLLEKEIETVRLTRAFKQKSEKEQLYWKDDTHWNGRGIELAVKETLSLLK